MLVNFGGTQLSCSDSSKSSLMIFLRGCPYRCSRCHNKELRTGENLVDLESIRVIIESNRFLISQVIFSGGEPFCQPEVIEKLAIVAKFYGLKIGLETSGYNSDALYKLLRIDLIDEVFLDLKTFGSEEYYKLTGDMYSWYNVLDAIQTCKEFGVPLELRTTVFEDYPSFRILEKIKDFVNENNLSWKMQEGRYV